MSSVRLLLELYCVVVIKHVAFFTIWAKLIMPFTRTKLPLNLYTSVFGCGCGFGFEQNFWRIDGFGEKKARIGGFSYPCSPPSSQYAKITCICKNYISIETLPRSGMIRQHRRNSYENLADHHNSSSC